MKLPKLVVLCSGLVACGADGTTPNTGERGSQAGAGNGGSGGQVGAAGRAGGQSGTPGVAGMPSGGAGSGSAAGAGGAATGAGTGNGGMAAGRAGGGAAGLGAAGGQATGGMGGSVAGSPGAGAGGVAGQGGASAGQGGAAGAGMAGATSTYQPCPATGACKIMPFGDSITQGFNVNGGYRAPLFELAHQAGHDITFVGSASDFAVSMVDGVAFPKNHEGHGGYTIDDNPGRNTQGISPFVGTSLPSYGPHIITLMIGTNDINGNIDRSTAPTRLGALLDSIHEENADILVVLAQIVPTTNDGTNQAVAEYNDAMPALVSSRTALGHHLVLVDMYGAMTKNASYKTALFADGLHPNQAGYDLMADVWYAALEPYLR